MIKLDKKLGFGTLRIPLLKDGSCDVDLELLKKMVDEYINAGYMYFEAAYGYQNRKNEAAVRICLTERHERSSYYIADKMPIALIDKKEQYQTMFDSQLKSIGVEYFDFYLLHNVGKEIYLKTERLGGFEFLFEQKRKGLAKNIGFSFHDSAEILEEILEKYHSKIDFVQLQINYLDWNSPVIQSKKCYEVALKYSVPIIVMEAVKGGRLAKVPEEAENMLKKINPDASIATFAYRYVASLEGVVLVLSGFSDMKHLHENIETMDNFVAFSREEHSIVKRIVNLLNDEKAIQCTNCLYCEEVCPKNIPISDIFSLYNSMQVTGNNDSTFLGRFSFLYKRLCTEKGKASDCVKCGKCNKVCSQNLDIIKNLEKIENIYESKIPIKIKLSILLRKMGLHEIAMRIKSVIFKGSKKR